MNMGTISSEVCSCMLSWPLGGGTAEIETPIAFGINLAQGSVRQVNQLGVETACGVNLPAQGTPLGYWADGSLRWLLVDCVVPKNTAFEGIWNVHIDGNSQERKCNTIASPAVELSRDDDRAIQLTIGRRALSFNRKTGSWSVVIDNKSVASADLPLVVDSQGRRHVPSVKQVRLIANGPLRATVEIRADYRSLRGLRVITCWSVFAGTDFITADITLHNSRRARHPGGLWDLGDMGSILLKDFTQTLQLAELSDQVIVRYRRESEHPVQTATGVVQVYQESSGGENWSCHNHVNRNGLMPLKRCGYLASIGPTKVTGLRAQPVVAICGPGFELAAEIENFWQQFPKALEASHCKILLRLFPEQFTDLHELQGGEQKRHRVWLAIRDAKENNTGSFGSPRHLQANSVSPNVIPGLPNWKAGDPAVLARLDELADEFLVGPRKGAVVRGLFANRERVDEYGWRNWGDIHADHEEQHYHGKLPLVSHYNNQFDVLLGFLLQYLRTGDQRWMDLAHPLAWHVIDIDIYHTTEDRPAYNGGLFWFTDHYLHAHTSSHRTYSRTNQPSGGSYGGGPGACHNFTTGLFLYHLLTGDSHARSAVITLADWVIGQDDGSRTVLGLVDDGPTGMASATSSALDHRPGRAAGNSINALLDAWLLTSEAKYLRYAELLIRRCVHPRQNIAALSLLNAEKYWSYTVFLVSLDKYLRAKLTAGESDENYQYARSTMVHYGRWMAEHERPYLDRPEQLEFPTEAWAAQEFRKANVLRLAANYAPSELARSMRERGRDLAERAWADLCSFPTRTSARAMAVLFVEGLRDAELRLPQSSLIEPTIAVNCESFPDHTDFQTQRERVKRQLRSPVGIALLLARAAAPTRWPRILNHV